MNGNEKFLDDDGYKINWGTDFKSAPAGITLSDEKIPVDVNNDFIADYYTPDIVSAQDYYPFGMLMPERQYHSSLYGFGYQGSLKDSEIYGKGSSYSTTFRLLEPRLGRWLTLDSKGNAFESPYMSMGDNPILNNDPKGTRIHPLNQGATAGFNSLLASFGNNIQVSKAFHIRYNKSTKVFYSADFSEPLSKRKFLRRARKSGVKIPKTRRATAYSLYHALTDQKVLEINGMKASKAGFTYGMGQPGTEVSNKVNKKLSVNPSLLRLQSDIKKAGSATHEIVNELFNPKNPNNPRYPAKLRGNNFVFFKGKSPFKGIQGSGGIKGTLEINATNKTPSQTGKTIGKALKKLYPSK